MKANPNLSELIKAQRTMNAITQCSRQIVTPTEEHRDCIRSSERDKVGAGYRNILLISP